MARRPLPDPHWADAPASCFACGYSLQGLGAPFACPECGVRYERRHLTLAGIPNASRGSSPARRAGWFVLIAGFVAHAYTFPFQIIFLGWQLTVLVTVVLAGSLIALLRTSPRERRGSERFCVVPGGVVRLPLDPGADESAGAVFVRWGGADAAELRRVSVQWKRLRIGRSAPGGGMAAVLFDAGIRCHDAEAELVLNAVRSSLAEPGAA